MKKIIFYFVIFLTLFITAIQAQEFESALADALSSFKTDSTLPQVAMTTGKFEMIATKWNDKWLAHYYASYAYAVQSFIEKEETMRDGLLDLADTHIQKAKEIYGKESDEFYVLSAMIASARLSVKPGSRWKEYGVIFEENINEAKQLNPDNPRIYYLQGDNLYYTPKMFGGGAKSALPYYEKADSLFKALPPPDSLNLLPSWGMDHNSQMLYEAKNELEKKGKK
ncbi:MAG: hypothetical protein JXB49_09515 [Bacteroidales bacterium]|nr:hypothetical protein [Bacteroidales bacterium]